jgi:hypothetical protein
VLTAAQRVSRFRAALGAAFGGLDAEAAANQNDFAVLAGDEGEFVGANSYHCHCRVPASQPSLDVLNVRSTRVRFHVQWCEVDCMIPWNRLCNYAVARPSPILWAFQGSPQTLSRGFPTVCLED